MGGGGKPPNALGVEAPLAGQPNDKPADCVAVAMPCGATIGKLGVPKLDAAGNPRFPAVETEPNEEADGSTSGGACTPGVENGAHGIATGSCMPGAAEKPAGKEPLVPHQAGEVPPLLEGWYLAHTSLMAECEMSAAGALSDRPCIGNGILDDLEELLGSAVGAETAPTPHKAEARCLINSTRSNGSSAARRMSAPLDNSRPSTVLSPSTL